jgi:hypothetical protein
MSFVPVLSFSGEVQQDETWVSQSDKLLPSWLSAVVTLQTPGITIGSLEIYVSNDNVTYSILNALEVRTDGADLLSLSTNITGQYVRVQYVNTGAARQLNIATKLSQSYVL